MCSFGGSTLVRVGPCRGGLGQWTWNSIGLICQRQTQTHPSLCLVKITDCDSGGLSHPGLAELASWAFWMGYLQAGLFSHLIYFIFKLFLSFLSSLYIYLIGLCRTFFSFVFIYVFPFIPIPPFSPYGRKPLWCVWCMSFYLHISLVCMHIFLVYINIFYLEFISFLFFSFSTTIWDLIGVAVGISGMRFLDAYPTFYFLGLSVPLVMRPLHSLPLPVTTHSAGMKIFIPISFLSFLIQFQDADLGFPLIILVSIGVWQGQTDLGEVLTFLELCLFLVNCDSGSQNLGKLLANSVLCCHLFAHLIGSAVNFPASCHRCCVLTPTTHTGCFLFLVRWWPGKLVQSAVMHHASEKALEPDCPAPVPRSSTSQLRDLGQLI